MIQVTESWCSGADDSSSCLGWLGCAPFPKSCSLERAGSGWVGVAAAAGVMLRLPCCAGGSLHTPLPAAAMFG